LEDGPSALTEADLDEYVAEAVLEHSRLHPRLVTNATLDGTGSAQTFQIDALTVPFEEGFSALQEVEYPTGSNPLNILDANTYRVERDTTGALVLRFLEETPGSGTNNIRLNFTARHSVSDSENSISDADYFAVCHLAASIAFTALAGKSAHSVQSSVSASEAGPRTQSDVYRAMAKEHRSLYYAHFGQSEKQSASQPGAQTIKDWDSSMAWGADRLTHHRRWI
jgi:hypothetical protein